MLTGFKLGHLLKQVVQLGGHGVLSRREIKLRGGEFGDGVLDAVHIGLGMCGFHHEMEAPRCQAMEIILRVRGLWSLPTLGEKI